MDLADFQSVGIERLAKRGKGLWSGQILGLFNLLKRGKVIIPVNNMTIGTAVV